MDTALLHRVFQLRISHAVIARNKIKDLLRIVIYVFRLSAAA